MRDLNDFHHRDGLHWYQAPLPPTSHECTAWSSGWIGLTEYGRCACGGVERNRSGHWMDRNSERRGEEPTDAG